jgi:hypothetical protein
VSIFSFLKNKNLNKNKNKIKTIIIINKNLHNNLFAKEKHYKN